MQVIGFNFSKMTAERIAKRMDKVNVKHNVSLKSVTRDEVELVGKRELAKVTFEFSVDYTPELGKINIEGNMILTDTPEKIKEILDNWKKHKKLTTEQTTMIINTVLVRSNIKALNLAQDVNLPPHIPLPKISPKVNTDNYIG